MRSKIQFTLILFTVLSTFAEDHPYCFLESCPNRTHTFCEYPKVELGSSCGKPIGFRLKPGEILAMLDLYNRERPVVNLYEELDNSNSKDGMNNVISIDYSVQWDRELADIAQRWAYQCTNTVDKCRNIDRFNVRQRVGMKKSLRHEAQPSIYPLISEWFHEDDMIKLEELKFDYNENILRIAANCYERMMKQTADRFGCGLLRSYDEEFNYVYLVCNYGPA